MKYVLLIAIALILQPLPSFAQPLDLSGYQQPDGAITTEYNGDKVDPYFATVSLLIAGKSGLNIQKQGLAWVNWALQQQKPSGLFNRYERDNGSVWYACDRADADDAMLALWVDLLYKLAPKTMPTTWKTSIDRAENQLSNLYNKELGIYHISADLPVGLLMDNVEIYNSFKNIALSQKKRGLFKQAIVYEAKMTALKTSILQVFSQNNDEIFLVSTQGKNGNDFYPDKVASVFPILYNLQGDNKSKNIYTNWIQANNAQWFEQQKEDYPWGLVAVAALAMNDEDTAACWQNHATPMRYSKHWNVLEEVALQSVNSNLTNYRTTGKIPCVKEGII